MKKRLLITTIIFALIMCVCPTNVEAKFDPFSSIGSKYKYYYDISDGEKLFTYMFAHDSYSSPIYDYEATFTAKSSNTKVIKVGIISNNTYEKDGYSQFYCRFHVVGSGKAKIYLTMKAKGKTYKKTVTYYTRKYSAPVSTFKIGKTNYASKLKSTCVYDIPDTDYLPVTTFSYKLKSKRKFRSVYYFDNNLDYHKIKSGKKIPENAEILVINYSKDGYLGTVGIESEN